MAGDPSAREEHTLAYRYIKDEVERVASKYGTRDPVALIRECGAILKYSDRYVSLKGYYFHSARSNFIVINAKLPRAEKRIVAAHELAHFILHREQAKHGPIHDTMMFSVSSRMEYEANLFCAELLLDDGEVMDAARETEGDFFTMSKTLGVMPELLLFKLHGMNERGSRFVLPLSLNSGFLK